MNLDRTQYIGASDTSYVMGRWFEKKTNKFTRSFDDFWSQKLGISEQKKFENIYTMAGTLYEEPIRKMTSQLYGGEIVKPTEPFII